MKFRVSEFYDGGLIQLDDVEVPSKRVGYKKQDGILVAKVPLGVPEFEAAIAQTFADTEGANWPMKGRLLVAISILLPKSSYRIKDVDNMAKSIVDAFRGIAYEDDKQIDALYVSKTESSKRQVWIALKSLNDSPKTWFLEPMMKMTSE